MKIFRYSYVFLDFQNCRFLQAVDPETVKPAICSDDMKSAKNQMNYIKLTCCSNVDPVVLETQTSSCRLVSSQMTTGQS